MSEIFFLKRHAIYGKSTEHRGSVSVVPVSCLCGFGFKSWPREILSEIYQCFVQSLETN